MRKHKIQLVPEINIETVMATTSELLPPSEQRPNFKEYGLLNTHRE